MHLCDIHSCQTFYNIEKRKFEKQKKLVKTVLTLDRGDSDNHLIVITTYMAPIRRVDTNNDEFPNTLVTRLFSILTEK